MNDEVGDFRSSVSEKCIKKVFLKDMLVKEWVNNYNELKFF